MDELITGNGKIKQSCGLLNSQDDSDIHETKDLATLCCSRVYNVKVGVALPITETFLDTISQCDRCTMHKYTVHCKVYTVSFTIFTVHGRHHHSSIHT